MKKTVAVLFGGMSSEHEVSLQSAAAVVEAIDTEAYEVLPVGITHQGQWLLCRGANAEAIRTGQWAQQEGSVPVALSPSREDHGLLLVEDGRTALRTVDLAFPVLHGRYGEDGTVQGLLALAGIPVVGCGALSSALGIDKAVSHAVASAAGVRCTRSAVVYSGEGDVDSLACAARAALEGAALPWFVKPAREGSSFGITRITEAGALPGALRAAFRYDDKVVVEEAVDGFEVGCAVLGGGNNTITGEVDAIRLAGGFFDYHEKYNLATAEILLPAPLPAKVAEAVKALARKIYRLFGCRGLARVDFFFTPGGEIVFNEINTMPGMTPHSRWPGMMAAVGLPFNAAIAQLLELAVLS